MRRLIIICMLISISLFTGCNDNENKIDDIQETNNSNMNDIILKLNNIESSISVLEEKIIKLEDSNEQRDLKVESIDVNGFKDSIDEYQEDIDFIERMIWG